jgi:hypothetical protein
MTKHTCLAPRRILWLSASVGVDHEETYIPGDAYHMTYSFLSPLLEHIVTFVGDSGHKGAAWDPLATLRPSTPI